MPASKSAMNPSDPFDLERFLAAQRSQYETALAELRAGAKRSHWMWFIFPQVRGLGLSTMAERYAINSRGEAEAYLLHPVLGARLRTCAEALLNVHDRMAREILGSPDDLKLRSSMTLFAQYEPDPGSVFQQVIDKYFAGQPDRRTLEILRSWK